MGEGDADVLTVAVAVLVLVGVSVGDTVGTAEGEPDTVVVYVGVYVCEGE